MKRFMNLSDKELEIMTADVPVKTFPKGTVLLHQGEIPSKCYFVLTGCVRQYAVDENGKENTSYFYTEEHSVTIFTQHSTDPTSRYSLSCLEECILVVGDLLIEQEMYDTHPDLATMTRRMMEGEVGQMQADFADFISSTPEQRFQALQIKRPELIDRVPQHQLASYLGMTPESLSRIKKRVERRRD